MTDSIFSRLEQYTLKHPEEVLIVAVEYEEKSGAITEIISDEIMIFKGFSSSLQRSTPADPDQPLVPPETRILSIDRLKSPYVPQNPQYLEQNLTWDRFEAEFV